MFLHRHRRSPSTLREYHLFASLGAHPNLSAAQTPSFANLFFSLGLEELVSLLFPLLHAHLLMYLLSPILLGSCFFSLVTITRILIKFSRVFCFGNDRGESTFALVYTTLCSHPLPSILPGGQPSAAALVDLGQQTGNSITWNVNQAVGKPLFSIGTSSCTHVL